MAGQDSICINECGNCPIGDKYTNVGYESGYIPDMYVKTVEVKYSDLVAIYNCAPNHIKEILDNYI